MKYETTLIGDISNTGEQPFEVPDMSKELAWLKSGRGCDRVLVLKSRLLPAGCELIDLAVVGTVMVYFKNFLIQDHFKCKAILFRQLVSGHQILVNYQRLNPNTRRGAWPVPERM